MAGSIEKGTRQQEPNDDTIYDIKEISVWAYGDTVLVEVDTLTANRHGIQIDYDDVDMLIASLSSAQERAAEYSEGGVN